jgi:methionyl-tRNA formyltransferase
MARPRVAFMGAGEIGMPALRWLRQAPSVELVALVTQPDRPVGRAQVLTPPAPKKEVAGSGVRVLQPERLRRSPAIDELKQLQPDLIVVMAYGQILPKSVLELPSIACLNLHASLLPRHRGAAPIQAALLAGDRETGVTVMHMAEGLDTGDIVLEKTLRIQRRDTGADLHDRLAELAPVALAEALELLLAGPPALASVTIFCKSRGAKPCWCTIWIPTRPALKDTSSRTPIISPARNRCTISPLPWCIGFARPLMRSAWRATFTAS